MKRRSLPIAAGDAIRLDERGDYPGSTSRVWARVVAVRNCHLVVDLTGMPVVVDGDLSRCDVVDGELSLHALGYVLKVTRREPWSKASGTTQRTATARAAARKVRS